MKINPISNKINFKGKIFDAHMHVGKENGFDTENLLNYFNEKYDGDTLEFGLISNLGCMGGINATENEVFGNTLTKMYAKSSQGKLIPIAVCAPHYGSPKFIENVLERNPNEFKALKFHPEGEELPANHPKYTPYLKLAQKNSIPCLFHCEIPWEETKKGWSLVKPWKRFSAPKQVYAAAKKIPDTPVVMAHLGAGGEKVHAKALDCILKSIEKNDALLYADISWVDCKNPEKPFLIHAIKTLLNSPNGDMTNRLVFGSDAPIGEFSDGCEVEIDGDKVFLSGTTYYKKEVSDIKKAIKNNFSEETSKRLIEDIFYNNAEKLYLKQQWY